jgi:alkanesulfonate monooxygenase SsuD/methylene tetrahydromethanopterin reductase-like flavin-dependent oxidoreductase (luciferase family)
MKMSKDHRDHLALKARIEQLAARLQRGDKNAEKTARGYLIKFAADGSVQVLTDVFSGLVKQWDSQQPDWEEVDIDEELEAAGEPRLLGLAYYTSFLKALLEFRNDGGAMFWTWVEGLGKGCWVVGTYQEVAEQVATDPKTATRDALLKGGMTYEQVEKMLEEWVDEDEEPKA